MIVVDASVAVKGFVEEPGRAAARNVVNSGEMLVAPDFVVLEILSVLRRKQRLKLISEHQIERAIGEISACFSEFMPATYIAEEALRLSMELDHSVYDCAYLACAIICEVNLITADTKFLNKILQTRHAHRVVNLVPSD